MKKDNKIHITPSLVKELRCRTGAGFVECKRALLEEKGDIELSIDNLRKSGKTKVSKKINNIANQGSIFLDIKNNIGIMLELNCQTDFVAKASSFVDLGKDIIKIAFLKKINNINDIKDIFKDKKEELILKTGENIKINRFVFVKGDNLSSYLHNSRIGVLVNAYNIKKEILKKIAMHIAASKPEYLFPKDVSPVVFNREYEIQLALSKKHNKSDDILKKIVDGRMKKFVNNISLMGQHFIIDPKKTISQIVSENNGCIKSFNRFEIGENKLGSL